MHNYTLILLAAGTGTRMELGYNKILYKHNGEFLINKVLNKFINYEQFKEILIVANKNDIKKLNQLIKYNSKIEIIIGGNNRQASVFQAIKIAKGEYCFVHDAARVNISKKMIDKIFNRIMTDGDDAYALAVRAKDSISQVKKNQIENTLKRDELYIMQTPQVVKTKILLKIHQKAIKEQINKTDEAGLVFYYHYQVKIIVGEYSNIKITTKEDLGAIK